MNRPPEEKTMELYRHGYSLSATCYSSCSFRECGDENSLVSGTQYNTSVLPRIGDSALQSRRTERFAPSTRREKTKVIRPSKLGYHRRGNSPTFQVLTEVCEKLQALVDMQAAKKLADSKKAADKDGLDWNSDEYFGDCSSTTDEEQDCIILPHRTKNGTLLELNYSSDIASPDSIVLTPRLPVHHYSRNSANTQLHLYLPRLTDTAETADSVDREVQHWGTKTDNSAVARSGDYANFYDSRHGFSDRDDRKSCDYKRSSLKYSKSGQKKSKVKKSKTSKTADKKQCSAVNSKSSSVLPSIMSQNISKDQEVPADQVDFLNDVLTLISEQRDVLQFSEASYTLPTLVQSCESHSDASKKLSSIISVEVVLKNDWESMDKSKKELKPDCDVCCYKQNPTMKFVDHLYGFTAADDTDDNNNNNSSANRVVGCVKC